MKLLATALFMLALMVSAQARLGETETEMIAHFGEPVLRSKHAALIQGEICAMGPSLHFKLEGWTIIADLVDGRCVRIRYRKRGRWTEDQIKLVLTCNAQSGTWTETTRSNRTKVFRTWLRSDGADAFWKTDRGMGLIDPAYEHAKLVKKEEKERRNEKQNN